MSTRLLDENSPAPSWMRIVGLAIAVILMCESIFTLHRLASFLLAGEPPTRSVIWYFTIPLGLAVTAMCWRKRDRFLSSSALRKSIVGFLLFFGLFSSYKVGGFLLYPTWATKTISQRLSKTLPEETILAGDWAPFFALETALHALYMNNYFNRAERIKILRPTHFLCSETSIDQESKHIIEQMDGVSLGTPIFRLNYNGSTVTLYPISYGDDDASRMAVKVPR